MNPLRSLRIYRARRDFQPPAGTTHVLEYLPPWLMHPEPDEGLWQLQTLGNWLAGTPGGGFTAIEGPPSMTEEDFGQFHLSGPDGMVHLDEAGFLGRLEVEVSDGDRVMTDAPAWWLEVLS